MHFTYKCIDEKNQIIFILFLFIYHFFFDNFFAHLVHNGVKRIVYNLKFDEQIKYKMTNCLFFGDSITYGEYDGILGGYVDDLKRYSHSKYYNENANEVNCFNLGIGGETTVGLLNRLENEIKARLSPDENLVFFFYGANDLAIKNNEEIVSLHDFKHHIETAINLTRNYTPHIFLISILPIASEIDGVMVASGKLRTTERIKLFNQQLKEIAEAYQISYLDIYSVFESRKAELISKDNVHPNEKGYALISDLIKPILDKCL